MLFAPPKITPRTPQVEPEQDSFLDDLGDSFRRSSYYEPLMSLAMLSEGTPLEGLLGGEERARRIEHQLATDPSLQTSNKVADFIGSVAGSVAPALVAVLNPITTPAVLSYYGAQALGSGRKAYRDYKLSKEEELSGPEEFAVALGYGTAEFLAERFGIKALHKVSTEAAKALGKGALKRAAISDPTRTAALLALGGRSAGIGGAEEAFTEAAQNVVDMIYDEDGRSLAGLIEGIPEAALKGAAGGVLVSGVATAVKRKPLENQEIQVQDIPSQRGYVARLARRYFTSRGDLPENVFDVRIEKDSWIKSQLHEASTTIGDLKGAVKTVYGDPSNLDEAAVKQLDDALKGQIPVDQLPEPLQAPIMEMRNHVDALSRKLIEDGAAEGDLAGVIEENMGVYITRAYRAFDDPAWSRDVPEPIRNNAKAYIRSEFNDTIVEEIAQRQEISIEDAQQQYQTEGTDGFEYGQQRIGGIIESLLFRDPNSPIAILNKGQLGAKDLSVFKKRKDIAPEIKALLGEYRDPMANYAESVRRMTGIVANHRFLKEAREIGLGTIFHENPVVVDGTSFQAQVSAEGSDAMSPLNGLYTTPEIKAAFERATSRPAPLSPMFQGYMKVLGASKAAKTIGSVMTQVRNFTANIGFATAQGHLNPLDPTSWKNAQYFSPAFKVLASGFKSGTPDGPKGRELRNYHSRLLELGVLDENVQAGELVDVFQDAGFRMADAGIVPEKGGAAVAKRVFRLAEKSYRAGDNFWKVVAFESEVERYKRAYPNRSIEDVERIAAKNVRNTYPTYSLVPEAVKLNRRNPLVGPFVSFPAEVMRTAFHTARLIREEITSGNAVLRQEGIKRLAGTVTAMTASTAAAAASRALLGIGKDEDEDMRRFLPPWQKNSQLFLTGKEPGGIRKHVDFSYSDPYAYLKKPVMALVGGQDPDGAMLGFVQEFFSPFLSEEIITQKVLDLRSNKTRTGGTVYNPQDSFEKRAWDMALHVAEGLEPGTLSGARRVADGISGQTESYGKVRDPKIDAAANLTGIRLETMDVPQGLRFKGSDFANSLRESSRIFTQTYGRSGRVSGEEIASALESTERSRRGLFDEMHKDVRAAIRLGLTEKQAFETLRATGVTKRDAKALLRGQYIPYEPSDDLVKRQAERARLFYEGDDLQRNMNEVSRRQNTLLQLLQTQR